MVNVIKKMKGNKLSNRMHLWAVVSLVMILVQVVFNVVANGVIEASSEMIIIGFILAVASELAEEIESLKEDK